jgi:outer membrane protein
MRWMLNRYKFLTMKSSVLIHSTLLFLLLAHCCPLAAQETVYPEQVIALALKKNYDILLIRNDSASAAAEYSFSYGGFLPRVNATSEKIWNINNQLQTFSDGTKREREGVRAGNTAAAVNLDWVLFDGFKVFATRERLKELVNLGTLSVKEQVVESVSEIIKNYYNIVRQQQQLKAIQEQMAVSETRVELADKRYAAGLGARPELLQAKVDLNAQKAAQIQQRTLIAQLKEQLNQLAGMQLPKLYEVMDSIPIDFDLNIGGLSNNIEQTNPTLQVAQKNITIAELLLKERKAERFPLLAFSSSYNFTRQVNSAVVNPAFALTSRNSGWNYGFGVSIPILNNLTVRRNISLAQFNVQYQQLAYENQRSIISTGVINAFKDYEYQKQALLLEEDNIRLAKENVSIALDRFRLGVSTNLELREAQISLEQAYNRLITTRYNTKVAETELKRLSNQLSF